MTINAVNVMLMRVSKWSGIASAVCAAAHTYLNQWGWAAWMSMCVLINMTMYERCKRRVSDDG